MSAVTMYTSLFFPPASLLSYSVEHYTHVCSLWVMVSTWPTGYTQIRWTVWGVEGWGLGGGGCAWNDHWYSVYSIFIYTHTVSLLRGLTVSVMDAVFTWSFHEFCSWIVMFTFTHRQHEGLTVSRGQRSHVPERTVFNSVKYVASRKTSCEAS